MTKGQQFTKDMRKNLGIGTRTRRFRNGLDLHVDILECIQHATFDAGWYRPEREELFRAAFGAWQSYNKHIAGYRANSNVISHINALSPWQFCALLGEMVDAEITNVGQGERFFADMARRIYTEAA
ncbi:hypothetical protein [Streptomyces sp. NPDC005799]|uniref:hypothetical protein n=1 Tax=Streptomyces sp. NPDC005799 TaxID=3154678 RepID=UPI0033EFD3C4